MCFEKSANVLIVIQLDGDFEQVIIATMHLLNRLCHDVLGVVDLALTCILAEAIEIFYRECDHVRLLGTDHFQISHPLLELSHATDNALALLCILI